MTTITPPSMFATPPAASPIDLRQLDRSLRRPRTFLNSSLSVLCGLLSLLAAVPLLSVLLMLVVRGGARLSVALSASYSAWA